MELAITIAGAVMIALFGLWLGARRFDRTIPPELRESLRLQHSDPAQAQFLAESYFRDLANKEQREREELWERAPRDLAAAEELRRRLSQDIEIDGEAEKEFQKTAGPDLLRTVRQSQEETRVQIAKLETIILALQKA